MSRYVVSVDIETTGLSPADDHIWEIGFVIEGVFRHTTSLPVQLPPAVMWSERAWEFFSSDDGPRRDQLVADPLRPNLGHLYNIFARARAVVAHNASFERGFLSRLDPRFDALPWVCTLELSRAASTDPTHRHHLAAACARHGVTPPAPAHRALPDAVACMDLFLALESLNNK